MLLPWNTFPPHFLVIYCGLQNVKKETLGVCSPFLKSPVCSTKQLSQILLNEIKKYKNEFIEHQQ